MHQLNIVLVEPQIPQNTGNIARTCAVTGARLHLIRPMGFTVTDKHLKRAGLDYWDKLDITYYDSFAEFSARNPGAYFFFTTKGRKVHSDAVYPNNAYLIFGREDQGLPEDLLFAHPEECVRIPMRNELRSLNLPIPLPLQYMKRCGSGIILILPGRGACGRTVGKIPTAKRCSMQKIKLMTDSTSDIDPELEQSLDIQILCFPVTVDGVGYRERQDFTNTEFYQMLEHAVEFPTTAQLTAFEIQEAYEQALEEGYTDLIYVTIASQGSATYSNAIMARDAFYAQVPDAEKLQIHVVDSKNYTGVYGYPVMQAAAKIKKGASVEEVLNYLTEWFQSAEVLFVPLTLKYAKRSGRISAAAAFAGELLGLKPLIRITDGVSKVETKIRGDKNIIPTMSKYIQQRMIPRTPYSLVAGCDDTFANELKKELVKKLGYQPEHLFHIGATVSCNAGPDVVGIIIRSEPRIDAE